MKAKLRNGKIIKLGKDLIIQFDVDAWDIPETLQGEDQVEDRGRGELLTAIMTVKGVGDINAEIGVKPPVTSRPRPRHEPRA